MKILCPFVELEWPVEFMLRAEHPDDVVWADCRGNDNAYFQAVREMWNSGETFVIVEQDILPWPGAVKKIYECPHKFCINWTPHWQSLSDRDSEPWTYAHGLVKYGQDLIHEIPNWFNDYQESQHWSQFDWNLVKTYQNQIHYHMPPVIHLSPIRFDSVKLVYSKRG